MESLIEDILRHPNLDFAGNEPDPAACIDPFLRFLSLWQKWNPKIQLTSERDAGNFFRQHVFDSLQYARFVQSGHKTLDIGSGGGFPAIPLKIIHPTLDLTLLESLRKKTGFLHAAGAELGFHNFRVLNQRAEDAAEDPALAGRFDRVTFRAVGSTSQCLDLAAPFLKPGGQGVVKKGLDEEQAGVSEDQPFELAETYPIYGYDGKESRLLAFRRI
ncbi:16S rRNA (guanine(527)-N(7))-methyltransferase RsmG [Nitrospina watsonii]|uniref:Ribosomal RNA small subunit methyltransferase G n=1 Tax=Nitrospina watsonii TaxID=1323948 RepID=A0ABN8W492_9BACT|nr:16S rRNA (guanine(527)-N(7))-methyltransferase RsmG [Nitrospina watsonii]CAI2719724.1 Ribosomal RNA small subunit methyltransferase G [Nitrospina watsonii]